MTSVLSGLPFMTSALRGEGVGPKADDSTDRLRESYMGEGVQYPENFADVINGSPRSRLCKEAKILFIYRATNIPSYQTHAF